MTTAKDDYRELIAKAQNRVLPPDIYRERHHVKPKCLGGTDLDGVVDLTAEEHFRAHQLLCELFPWHFGLAFALWAMCIGKNRLMEIHEAEFIPIITPQEYAEARHRFIERAREQVVTEETKALISLANGREVHRYSLGGAYIDSWLSTQEAEVVVGEKTKWGTTKDNIGAAARGEQKSAYGHLWSYEKASQIAPYKPTDLRKEVFKWDLDGKLCGHYESAAEAARAHGIEGHDNVPRACRKSGKTGSPEFSKGWLWSYSFHEEVENWLPPTWQPKLKMK